MKKVICFSTKNRNIEIGVHLNEKNNLTIQGFIHSKSGKTCYNGGQCEDSIKALLPDDAKFAEIYAIWKEYHLNDMQPGTPKQTEALKGFEGDYTKQCKYLESIGLLIDDGYKYGTQWLRIDIPENVIETIKSW